MTKQQVAFRQFVIVASTLVDQCRRSCRVGVASPLYCFLTVYAIFLVGVFCCCKRAIVCVLRCLFSVSRDTDDKTSFMCMLCCSMVRCTESVLSFQQEERRRHHGVDCRRVVPSVFDGNDLFFGLFTAEQGCTCWNVFWHSWGKDDEKWKSRLRRRVKKCFRWDFWQSCFTHGCVLFYKLLTWSTSAEHVRNRAEEFIDCCRHVAQRFSRCTRFVAQPKRWTWH